MVERRILVVDDKAVNRFVVRKMLEGGPYALVEASSGAEAVAGAHAADAILMDLSMPGMDGFEATRRIRRDEAAANLPRRPILAVSAHSGEEERAHARSAGIDDYITKPVRKPVLIAALDRAFATRDEG